MKDGKLERIARRTNWKFSGGWSCKCGETVEAGRARKQAVRILVLPYIG
jgi:hypothetical protein